MVDNVTGEVIEQKAVKPIFDQSEVMRILNDEVDRYPSIQADQEYATKKVISKFVSGELDAKLTEQTADAIKKNVDALSMYNIIESQKLSERDDDVYMQAVESGDEQRIERILHDAAKAAGMATDSIGKLIDLYHGTPSFGFTVFEDKRHSTPFIYTSTKNTVAAHYAGDNNYAFVRKIGRKYRGGDSISDIIADAETVYESKYHVMSEQEKAERFTEIKKGADKVADKLNEFRAKVSDSVVDWNTEEGERAGNAVALVEQVVWDITDSDMQSWEEYQNDEYGYKEEALRDFDRYENSQRIVREFFDNHRSEMSPEENAYFRYLTGFELGDTAIDIIYGIGKQFRNDTLIVNESGNVAVPSDLRNAMDQVHNIGAYHLYGNLGDNPFEFDANGGQFYALKVPEVSEGYVDTDTVSKWALEHGYTSVIMRNIYDYGDRADNYVFFDSAQVKSADPVTYDDNGDVIPLSERFNTQNNDIRYSLRGYTKDGIEVYETSEETLSLPWKARKKRYLDFIRKDYRGRTAKFVRNGHTYYAEYDRKNASKSIYGDSRSDPEGIDAIINTGADGDVFELVENSHYTRSSPNGKNNTDADYFDYFVKTVQIDGKVFDLLADVEKKYNSSSSFVYTFRLIENKRIKASPIQEGLASLKNSDDAFIQDNPTTSSPKSQEGKGNLYSDRDDVGYHAGNLGKSEYLNVQGRGRDTGHFGTGTYFVGTQEKVTEDSYYGKRPQHAVDFSKYNLFKVGTDKRGYKLHDALRVIDGGVNEDWIEAASNNVWRIVNTTDWYDYAEETFGDDWYEYKNRAKAIKDTAKKYGLELPSDEDFMKAEGFTSPDEEDFYEYQGEYFRKAFNEAADKVNGEYERFRDAYDDLLNVFGYHTAKVNSAIRAVAEYQKTADKRAKVDSYATVFMKAMGYDGVDVRGTGLDNTGYGSVIYNLKDNTVLYSDRGEASTDSRTLLSNALASAVTNDIEKAKLSDYQAKIEQMNETQNRLTELRAQIREISFGKGKRDMAKLSQLRDEAAKLANRVNVYDKQLLRLEATKPLQKVLEREKAKAYKKAKAESKEALKAYKESAARKQQQIIDRYNERIARSKERRDMTLLRNKIKKISEDFKQRLLNGTDRRYVPSGLVEGVISVCEAIDPTGRDQSTKAAQRYRDGKAALLNLKNAYDSLQYEDYDFSSEFSEEFSSHISELANAVGNTPLRDMSYEQLQDVHDILSDIKFMLQQATKQIGIDEAITNYEAGQELIDVMRYVEEKGLTTGKVSSFFRNWTENPMRATREMSAFRDDSRLKKLFDQLNEGRRKMETFRMNAYKEFDKLRASKEDAKNFNDAVEKAFDFGLKDRYGKPLKITKMQAMQLVLTWEREQANKGRKHLESGAVIPDIDLQAKGKFKEAKRAGQHTGMITQETIDTIESKLSEWDKKYLDTARNFFNGMAKDAINETTMVTRHRPIATEASYIPYVVNKDYVKKESDNVKFDATIEGWGSLKSVKNNAPQELIMNGLNAVAADHIDSVGKVYGLSIPVRNFNKVFNMQQTIENGGIAVKEAIGDAWGEAGLELIDKAVADVQTPRRHDTVPAVQFIKSAFVQSTLASNISVSIKQAASYPTAGAYLKGASLLKGLAKYATVKNQEVWDEIDEHTSQHWLRRIGLSTQELGEMNQTKGWQNKLNKKLGKASPMNWIQTIDVGTTAALWYACKAEVESKGIKQTDARYWDEVTKLYDTVIEETQPMYDSLHRAEITKRSGLNNIIMFQTQPIQNSGILREGAMEYKTAKKQYGAKSAEAKAAAKKFGMAVSSQAASHFVFTAMTLLAGALLHKMNPWRDKDKEVTPESVLEEFAKEFGENYFSAIVPIFGSLAVSAVEKLTGSSNYDVLSDSVVDKINTSIDKLSKPASALWDKIVNGEDSTKLEELTWENYVDVASEAASYFGIPLANAKNIIWGAIQNGIDAVNGELGSFEYGTTRTKKQEVSRAYSEYTSGDTEKAKSIIKDMIDEKKAEGKTDKEAKQAVRTSCTDYFKPLLLEAYKSKDNETMVQIRKAMAATGVYDDVPEATQKWIKDSQKKK